MIQLELEKIHEKLVKQFFDLFTLSSYVYFTLRVLDGM